MTACPVARTLAAMPLAEHAERTTELRLHLVEAARKLEDQFRTERTQLREHLTRIGVPEFCVLDFRARWKHEFTYLYLEWSTHKRVNDGQGGKRSLRGHIKKGRGDTEYSLPELLKRAPVQYHALVTRTEQLARPIRVGFIHLRAINDRIDDMVGAGLGAAPGATSDPALPGGMLDPVARTAA